MFKTLGVPENEQIEHKMLSSAIEKAQKKIESNNFGIRKNLLEYDQVNNEQREIIYKERRRVLDGESMRDSIYKMISRYRGQCRRYCVLATMQDREDWNLDRAEPAAASGHSRCSRSAWSCPDHHEAKIS